MLQETQKNDLKTNPDQDVEDDMEKSLAAFLEEDEPEPSATSSNSVSPEKAWTAKDNEQEDDGSSWGDFDSKKARHACYMRMSRSYDSLLQAMLNHNSDVAIGMTVCY